MIAVELPYLSKDTIEPGYYWADVRNHSALSTGTRRSIVEVTGTARFLSVKCGSDYPNIENVDFIVRIPAAEKLADMIALGRDIREGAAA